MKKLTIGILLSVVCNILSISAMEQRPKRNAPLLEDKRYLKKLRREIVAKEEGITLQRNELSDTAKGWHNLHEELRELIILFLPECLGFHHLSKKNMIEHSGKISTLSTIICSRDNNTQKLINAFKQYAALQSVNTSFANILRYKWKDLGKIIKNIGKFNPYFFSLILNKAAKFGCIEPFQLALEGDGKLEPSVLCPWLIEMSSYKQFEACGRLIKLGAGNKMPMPNIMHALLFNNREEFERLFLEQEYILTNAILLYLFKATTQCGHIELFKFLLGKIKNINPHNEILDNALPLAGARGHYQIIQLLLDSGADINNKGSLSGSILQSSIANIETVKFLIEKGADINIKDNGSSQHILLSDTKGLKGGTILHFAVTSDAQEVMEFLLDQHININAQTDLKETALMKAAERGSLGIVKCLLEKGADINIVNQENSTVLHYAAAHGNCELIQYLLDLGIDINATNIKGLTPLHLAAMGGHLEAVELLVQKGANINAEARKIVGEAVYIYVQDQRFKCRLSSGQILEGWFPYHASHGEIVHLGLGHQTLKGQIVHGSFPIQDFIVPTNSREAKSEMHFVSTPYDYAMYCNNLEVAEFLWRSLKNDKENKQDW